jgi:hypothetical protein
MIEAVDHLTLEHWERYMAGAIRESSIRLKVPTVGFEVFSPLEGFLVPRGVKESRVSQPPRVCTVWVCGAIERQCRPPVMEFDGEFDLPMFPSREHGPRGRADRSNAVDVPFD